MTASRLILANALLVFAFASPALPADEFDATRPIAQCDVTDAGVACVDGDGQPVDASPVGDNGESSGDGVETPKTASVANPVAPTRPMFPASRPAQALPTAPDQEPTDPAAGGPPMLTNDTGTAEHIELNSACTPSHAEGATTTTCVADANYALGSRSHFNVVLPWVFRIGPSGQPAAHGLGSGAIGVKYRFLEKGGFSISVFPAASFNLNHSTVTKGLVDKGPALFLPIELQKSAGRFTVGSEVGYTLARSVPGSWFHGLLAGWTASPRLQLMTELAGNSARDFSEHTLYLNVGGRWKLSKVFSFFLSAGHTVSTSDRRGGWIAYIGLQTRK